MVKLMTMDSSTLATDGTIETFKGSRSLRKNAELLPGHSSKSNGSEMKKRGLRPRAPVYTALFNACANSPWPEDGLRRAHHLLTNLREKGYSFNQTQYNCMVMAFGMCGDMRMAFELMDEMQEVGHLLDNYSYAGLLHACISDKHAGLKHVIEVWRKMRQRRIAPNLHNYNLLLRAIRDCCVGETSFANQLLQRSSSRRDRFLNSPTVTQPHTEAFTEPLKPELLRLEPLTSFNVSEDEDMRDSPKLETKDTTEETPWFGMSTDSNEQSNSLVNTDPEDKMVHWWDIPPDPATLPDVNDLFKSNDQVSVLNMEVPNILNPRGIPPWKLLRLEGLDTPQARLALVGGLPGFLSHMQKDGVQPDETTFIMLASCIPPSKGNDDALFQCMRAHGVKPVINVYNELIRKYCRKPGAKVHMKGSRSQELVTQMIKDGFEPDYKTFGSLAVGCHTRLSGMALLKNMEELGTEITINVINILMKRTFSDFRYILYLCKEMKRLEIEPNAHTMTMLEGFIQGARRALVDMERGKDVHLKYKVREKFREEFYQFMEWYTPWIKDTLLAKEKHPWQQFFEPSDQEEDKKNIYSRLRKRRKFTARVT